MTDRYKKAITLSDEQEKLAADGRFNEQALIDSRSTDPNFTKAANVRGNNITAIDPAYQQSQAEKVWGLYGTTWGLRNMDVRTDEAKGNKSDYAFLMAEFYYPGGSFQIINGILTGSYAQGKFDPEWPKKLQTSTVSKALAYLGFNRDVFLGKFDDERYVQAQYEAHEEIEYVSEDDLAKIRKLCTAAGVTEEAVAKGYTVAKLEELPKDKVARVIGALNNRIRENKAKQAKSDAG